MEEEVRKQKYRHLQKNVKTIKNALYELELMSEEVEACMMESLEIDHKIKKEEQYKNLKKELESIEQEVESTLLSKIRENC